MTTVLCGMCFAVLTGAEAHLMPEGASRVRCPECGQVHPDTCHPFHYFAALYEGHRAASARLDFTAPAYSLHDLLIWLVEHPEYAGIWHAYAASDYADALRPCLFRIDKARPYRLDNLYLTWRAAAVLRLRYGVTVPFKLYDFASRQEIGRPSEPADP